jgi:hypothetical protein
VKFQPITCGIKKVDVIEVERRMVVTRGWEGRGEERWGEVNY